MMAVEGKVNPVAADKHSDRLADQENALYLVEEAMTGILDWVASHNDAMHRRLCARAIAYATGGDQAVMAVLTDVLDRAAGQLP